MTLHAFPDTNTLLEFEMFDQVDWPSILNVPDVCLIIAPIVISELDKHKNNSGNPRLQKRARTVLRKLLPLLEEAARTGKPAEVRNNVTIDSSATEPNVDWTALGLDPTINDDRLIASVLEASDVWDLASVVLVTNDGGPRLKAVKRGIHAVDPEDYIKRVPATEEDASRKKLEQEIQRLTNLIPKLELGFSSEESATNIAVQFRNRPLADRLPIDRLSKASIEVEIEAEKRRRDVAISNARGMGISKEHLDEYNERFDYYLSYLKRVLTYGQSRYYGPSCELSFALRNVGTATANHVEIQLQFPPYSFVYESSHSDIFWSRLDKPARPQPPVPLSARGPFDFITTAARVPSTAPERTQGWFYYSDDRHAMLYKLAKLHAGQVVTLPDLMTYLHPDITPGFGIKYAVFCEGLREPHKGTLNVREANRP